MKHLDSRAVVVNHGDNSMALYMNVSVLRALARGVPLADGLRDFDGEKVILLYYDGLSTAGTNYFYEAVERALGEQNASYGALFSPTSSPGSVIIATAHETYRDNIISAKVYCICNKNEDHFVEKPPAAEKQSCRQCDGIYDDCL
jgi:hypothetical protein